MNLPLARENIKSKKTDVILPSLKIIAEAGTLSDLQSVMALLKNKNTQKQVQELAVLTAATLIRENLITHFNQLDEKVRTKLGTILETLHPNVVAELAKDAMSENENRRLRAVQILGLLKKNPKVRDILARLVTVRDQKIRATAVSLLGKLTNPQDPRIILSLLNDDDKRVRANTVEAIESLGNKRLVPILLRFRHDPNNRIRGNVIKALFNLGYTDIFGLIIEMLTIPDDFMKASALWVLSQIKSANKEIIDLCGFHLLSENEMVVNNARKALKAINIPRCKGFLYYFDEPEEDKPHSSPTMSQ